MFPRRSTYHEHHRIDVIELSIVNTEASNYRFSLLTLDGRFMQKTLLHCRRGKQKKCGIGMNVNWRFVILLLVSHRDWCPYLLKLDGKSSFSSTCHKHRHVTKIDLSIANTNTHNIFIVCFFLEQCLPLKGDWKSWRSWCVGLLHVL